MNDRWSQLVSAAQRVWAWIARSLRRYRGRWLGVALVGALAVNYLFGTGDVPFVRSPVTYSETPWVIAVYEGPSFAELKPRGSSYEPVLTRESVTGEDVDFVADPFWIEKEGVNYIFFEYFNNKTKQGDLGVALSEDGKAWTYVGTVLDEPFHLSYPQVFEHEGAIYMLPETGDVSELRLYKADDFPTKWSLRQKLMDGKFWDPSIFRYRGRWWVFALTDLKGRLDLFYADDLLGPWQPHPANPIVKEDKNISRPGGRVLVEGDRVYRMAQDNDPAYGMSIRAFEITTLTPTQYEEREAFPDPILGGDRNWFIEDRIHQLDAKRLPDGRWLGLIDRYEVHRELRLPIGP
jgi:hypothetical protein